MKRPAFLRYAALFQKHAEELIHQFAIQQALAGFLAHGLRGLVMPQRRLVRPRRAQRVIYIHHLQNPRQQRNLARRKPSG